MLTHPLITALAASGLVAGAAVVTSANTHYMALSAQQELIEMGGTGQPTVSMSQLELVRELINDRYGTDFQDADGLRTAEGLYSGTYNDDEIYLLNDLPQYQGDDVTVFGVSQSAGVIGMTIRDIDSGNLPQDAMGLFRPDLDPGVTVNSLPQDIHWVALSPPSMPQHLNAAGLFQRPETTLLNYQELYPSDHLPFPNAAGNADVYCGMYDFVCDYPTTGDSYAQANSFDGLSDIHVGYGSLTLNEANYELGHATEFTIGPNGSVTIYPDQEGAPADMTHFYLMPDVHNFGADAAFHAPGADYDSYLPALAFLVPPSSSGPSIFQSLYEEYLPYDTLRVDAGYDDALHPFEYMINGTEYTFYDPVGDGDYEVIPVSELPASVSPPVVDLSDFNGSMGALATEIAYGEISPTGADLTTDMVTAATAGMTDVASDPSWLIG